MNRFEAIGYKQWFTWIKNDNTELNSGLNRSFPNKLMYLRCDVMWFVYCLLVIYHVCQVNKDSRQKILLRLSIK